MLMHEPSPDWMSKAACVGADPGLFFPERGEMATAAKRMCSTCPVKQRCLEYALDHKETHGIWGGLSYKERRPLMTGRPRISTCKACGVKVQRLYKVQYCQPCMDKREREWNRRSEANRRAAGRKKAWGDSRDCPSV